MQNWRKVAAGGALAVALAAGGLVVAPTKDASAASANTSGLVSRHLRTYDTWRTKTPGQTVSLSGKAGNWDCCWGSRSFHPTLDNWTLGLRSTTNSQFSSKTYVGPNASGVFPNTGGVTYTMVFAINTRAAGHTINEDSEAVAPFSGTLNY